MSNANTAAPPARAPRMPLHRGLAPARPAGHSTGTAAAANTAEWRVSGHLAADAAFAMTNGDHGAGVLVLLIDQGPDLPLVRARHNVGRAAAALRAADAKARHMRKGTRVIVYGRGLAAYPLDHLEITGVFDVIPATPIAFHHDPEANRP